MVTPELKPLCVVETREGPRELMVPTDYDRYFDNDTLPCLIRHCRWHGRAVAMHMAKIHGIAARDFKQLAGFNLGGGVVTRDSKKKFREAAYDRDPDRKQWQRARRAGLPPDELHKAARQQTYRSSEAEQHHQQVIDRLKGEPGETRICACGARFQAKMLAKKTTRCPACRVERRKERQRQLYPRKIKVPRPVMPRPVLPCQHCGEPIPHTRTRAAIYCTDSCKSAAIYQTQGHVPIAALARETCGRCGVTLSEAQRAKGRRYCSTLCKARAKEARRCRKA